MPEVLSALIALGYEAPTPVQEKSYNPLIEGLDLVVQAQTGTGKTGAFAIPLLSKIDLSLKEPQVLVVAPTRELAIQVSEAFQSYARSLKGFHVTPIYGGQDYQVQLRALKRGPHVVVGTPGRIMDHMRRGTLSLGSLQTLVLDEADEMLKMGFKEDVEWMLEQIPQEHQTALFSATMPSSIQQIAKRHFNNPHKIQITPKESTVDSIEQFFIRVNRTQKLDVLTRLLEVENVKAAIIFARTKTLSAELAEKLQARGYAAAALNGDMSQSMREKVLSRLKKGSLDIVVATDVAARGIDVERISHVFNYDIPCDPESYIHRIGRTGRAGRQGRAFLFVSSREQHLLKDIERAVHKPIEQVMPPSLQEMSTLRSQQLAGKIVGIVTKSKKYQEYLPIVAEIVESSECSMVDVAAALAYLVQESNPLPSEELTAVEEDSGDGARGRRRRGGPSRSNAARGPSRSNAARGQARGNSRGGPRGGSRGESKGGSARSSNGSRAGSRSSANASQRRRPERGGPRNKAK